MDIKLTFLGTSNSVPTAERNHSAFFLEYNGEYILVDCGEGTQRQFKRAGLNAGKITTLLITHLHGDHVLGIPGLLQTLCMSEYQKTLSVFGPRGTARHFHGIESLYGRLGVRYAVKEGKGIVAETKEWRIEALPMQHNIETLAYAFTIKDKLRVDKKKLAKLKVKPSPLLKQLQEGKDIVIDGKKLKAKELTYEQKGKKVVFIMDTAYTEAAVSLSKNADLLVCEATYSDAEKDVAKEHQHLTTTQAATIAKKAGVKKLILTHTSPRYEPMLDVLQKEARKVFKNTTIAKDLDSITF